MSKENRHNQDQHINQLLQSEEWQNAIREAAPAARAEFKANLKHKLLSQHHMKHTEHKKGWNWSLFKYGLGFVAVVIVALVASYPFIPAPTVQGYLLKGANREISLNAPLKITFSQMMDQASVEKNFQIEPAMTGKMSWNGNVLIFDPDQDLKLGETFTVRIGKDAKSLIQKPLLSEYQENYVVVKSPEVSLIIPNDQSTEVPADTKLTVMFSQPMVELTTLEANSAKIPNIKIEPSVSGKWQWLGTAAVQFEPERWQDATAYKVTVPKDIESIDGGKTEQEVISTFETSRPQVLSVHGDQFSSAVYQKNKLILTANQQLDAKTLPEKVKIYRFTGKKDAVSTNGNLDQEKLKNFIGKSEMTEIKFNARAVSREEVLKIKKNEDQVLDLQSWEEVASSIDDSLKTMEIKDEEIARQIVLEPQTALEAGAIYLVTAKEVKGQVGELTSSQEAIFTLETIGDFKIKDHQINTEDQVVYLNFTAPVNLKSFRGRLILNPLRKDADGKDIEITPSVEGDNTIAIHYNYLPSTKYTLEVREGAEDWAGNKLTENKKIEWETPARKASLELKSGTDLNIVDGSKPKVFYLQSTNVADTEMRLIKLNQQQFEAAYSNGYVNYQAAALLNTVSQALALPLGSAEVSNSENPDQNLIWRRGIKLENKFNETNFTKVDLEKTIGQDLPSGYYYLEFFTPRAENSDRGLNNVGQVARALTVITRSALTIKHSEKELLVWATDLSSGKAVEGMSIVANLDGQVVSGTTAADGITKIALPSIKDGNYYREITVRGEKGADVTFAHSSWSEGVSPWNFGLSFDKAPARYFAYVFTDRPIYRPGNLVFFKGIVRTSEENKLTLPKEKKVDVTVTDSRGDEVLKKTYDISNNGTFNGELQLGQNIRSGIYNVRSKLQGSSGPEWQSEFYSSFKVAEYRKPDYKLDITPNKESYINGEKASIKVNGGYFFGAPMPNAKVKWTVRSQDYFFYLPEKLVQKFSDAWFSFSDDGNFCYFGCTGETSLVTTGESTLDAQGNFTLDLPLNISSKKISQIYTFEFTVSDQNNQSVSNRASAVVHQGEFYVGIRNKDYLAEVNKPAKLEILSTSPAGDLLGGKGVEVNLYERKWNTVMRKNVDSGFYYENNFEDTLVEKKNVTTGGDGLANVEFVIKKGGQYKVEAVAKDGRGNKIVGATTIYVTGGEAVNWGLQNNDKLEIVADKMEYEIGDTAKILVKSPYAGVQALVTTEREKIYSTKVMELDSNSQTIEIPVTKEFLPNMFVSVILVKGSGNEAGLREPAAGVNDERAVASFKAGYVMLPIKTESKKLNVEITADKAVYLPGSEVTLKLKTSNYKGEGVPAELSVSVVDKSVLSLTENVMADLLNIFYRQRALSVEMAQTLTKAISRINVVVEAGIKGGGGGAIQKRGEFKDTAYFGASVKTAADGTAELKFKLPDNLTTWQVLALGISDDSQKLNETNSSLVGSAKIDLLARKEVMMRAVLPRFVTKGDEFKVGVIVHNYLNDTKTFQVSANNNLNLPMEEKQITIAKEQSVKLEWPLTIDQQASDQLILNFRAVASGTESGDALEQILPIYEASFPTVVATSAVYDDQNKHTQNVWLPIGLNPNQGKLSVSVTPSLAGSLNSGLEYLLTFPYGCAEQLSSAILPNLALKQLVDLKKFQTDMIDTASLQRNVEAGLQGLYKIQQANGGFGLWSNSETSLYTSAYVLYAMEMAKKSGYSVDAGILERTVKYINNQLNQQKLNKGDSYAANSRAFALFVLSEFEKADLGLLNNLYEHKDSLQLFGKAYLAMAYANSGDAAAGKVAELRKEVLNAAKSTDRGVHFEEQNNLGRLFDTNRRTTALVLQMLSRTEMNNSLTPKIVEYLMTVRPGSQLQTTQETAVTLLSLIDYLKVSNELNAAYNAEVTVAGETLINQKFSSENIFEIAAKEVALNKLQGNNLNNEITISKQGEGKIYFNAELQYFLPVEQVKAVNRGMEITQEFYHADDQKMTRPVSEAKVGDNLKAKMTIVVPEDRDYVMVEDYLPAGLEGIDFTLNTSEQNLTESEAENWRDECQGWDCFYSDWYFNHQEVKDDRMMYFADYLPKGVYEITYFVRATTPGKFVDKPAQAMETYFPEVFARTAAKHFIVNQ